MLTVANTVAAPAIGKYSLGLVFFHDLPDHAGHELKVIGTESTGNPQFRIGPMTAFFSIFRYCDPVGMSIVNILPCRVRIRAEDDRHVHLPASTDHITQRIGCTEPITSVMQRNVGWIECYYTAGAQQRTVGMNFLKIAEPEVGIKVSRIIFHKSELSPPHGVVKPGSVSRRTHT